MRVAILADTHGFVDPRVLDLLTRCDLAIHGGDIGGAGVLAALQPGQGRVIATAGNNDIPRKWPDHEHQALTALPQVSPVPLPGAAGRERTFGGPSCMLLTATEHAWDLEIRRFEPSMKRSRETAWRADE